MNLLARRLYNGGFNHLKSTSFLISGCKAPRVSGHPALTRSCSVAAAKLSGDKDGLVRAPLLSPAHTRSSPAPFPFSCMHVHAFRDRTCVECLLAKHTVARARVCLAPQGASWGLPSN